MFYSYVVDVSGIVFLTKHLRVFPASRYTHGDVPAVPVREVVAALVGAVVETVFNGAMPFCLIFEI